jgi:hypothetical protein
MDCFIEVQLEKLSPSLYVSSYAQPPCLLDGLPVPRDATGTCECASGDDEGSDTWSLL